MESNRVELALETRHRFSRQRKTHAKVQRHATYHFLFEKNVASSVESELKLYITGTGVDYVVKVSCVMPIWGKEKGSFVDVLILKYLFSPHVEA